jgi:hypothetical protein
MKWLKQLFVEEVHEDSGPSEIAVRVAEIQARIAAFRSSLEWTEKSDKNTSSQPKLAMATEQQPAVKAGSDNLKAKLLAMKK